MTRVTVNSVTPNVTVTNQNTGGTYPVTQLVGISNGYPKTVNIRDGHLNHPKNTQLKQDLEAIVDKLPIEVDLVYEQVAGSNGMTFPSLVSIKEATGAPPAQGLPAFAPQDAARAQGKPYQKSNYVPKDDNVLTNKDKSIVVQSSVKAAVELINSGKVELGNLEKFSTDLTNFILKASYGVTLDGEVKESE